MVDNFGTFWVLQVPNEMDSVSEAEWLVPVELVAPKTDLRAPTTDLGAPTTDIIGAPTTPLQQDLLVPACQPGDALAWLRR